MAWATESVASFLLMTIVLVASNSGRFARWTAVLTIISDDVAILRVRHAAQEAFRLKDIDK